MDKVPVNKKPKAPVPDFEFLCRPLGLPCGEKTHFFHPLPQRASGMMLLCTLITILGLVSFVFGSCSTGCSFNSGGCNCMCAGCAAGCSYAIPTDACESTFGACCVPGSESTGSTGSPSSYPSAAPSSSPRHVDSTSVHPTRAPTTRKPSSSPGSSHPSRSPLTSGPSVSPTSSRPSQSPTTSTPSVSPTNRPSRSPTVLPSRAPSRSPTASPSKIYCSNAEGGPYCQEGILQSYTSGPNINKLKSPHVWGTKQSINVYCGTVGNQTQNYGHMILFYNNSRVSNIALNPYQFVPSQENCAGASLDIFTIMYAPNTVNVTFPCSGGGVKTATAVSWAGENFAVIFPTDSNGVAIQFCTDAGGTWVISGSLIPSSQWTVVALASLLLLSINF